MLLYKLFLFLLLSSLGSAEYYSVSGEDFVDFIGDSDHFHVESYDSISSYGIPSPTAGKHDEALYLTDINYPSSTPFTSIPSFGTVTLEFRFFCDGSDSQLELVIYYNQMFENIILCGRQSNIMQPGNWVSELIARECMTGDCTHIDLALLGETGAIGDIVGIYSLAVLTANIVTTLIPTSTTIPAITTTTTPTTSQSTTLPNCPTDDMVWIAGEAYKIICESGVTYTWDEAQELCSSYGLIMAEPKTNASEVAAYLLDNYDSPFFWWGGRSMGAGSNQFYWVVSGEAIPADSPYWYPGYGPGEYCDAADGEGDCCLEIIGYYVDHPYTAIQCSYPYHVMCQCPPTGTQQ